MEIKKIFVLTFELIIASLMVIPLLLFLLWSYTYLFNLYLKSQPNLNPSTSSTRAEECEVKIINEQLKEYPLIESLPKYGFIHSCISDNERYDFYLTFKNQTLKEKFKYNKFIPAYLDFVIGKLEENDEHLKLTAEPLPCKNYDKIFYNNLIEYFNIAVMNSDTKKFHAKLFVKTFDDKNTNCQKYTNTEYLLDDRKFFDVREHEHIGAFYN